MRRWTHARGEFIHRARNGIYDPYTIFHLTDALTNIQPWQQFTAAEMAEWLNQQKPQFVWDAVTVGRILNDMVESLRDANAAPLAQPIIIARDWAGTSYEMTNYTEAREVLLRLLDDLVVLGQQLRDVELSGQPSKRQTSPFANCPSLTHRLREAG